MRWLTSLVTKRATCSVVNFSNSRCHARCRQSWKAYLQVTGTTRAFSRLGGREDGGGGPQARAARHNSDTTEISSNLTPIVDAHGPIVGNDGTVASASHGKEVAGTAPVGGKDGSACRDGGGDGQSGHGAGDNEGKGSSSGSGWGRWWATHGGKIGTVIAAVAAVAAVADSMHQRRANEQQRLSTVEGQAEQAAKRISASKLDAMDLHSSDGALIERTGLINEIRAYLSRGLGVILLYGPRGAGKSTALELAFKDRQSVVHVTVSHYDKVYLGDLILKAIDGRVPDGASGEMIIEAALKKLKTNSSGGVPTIIVDVDCKCSGQQLQDTLLMCKRWGADKRLANFFVDVSSSRAALQLTIGLGDLRVIGLRVGELSQEEAEFYVIRLLGPCSALNGDWRGDGTMCTLAQYAIEGVGKVVLHLLLLAKFCQPLHDDALRLKQQIDKYVMKIDKSNDRALDALLGDLEASGLKKGFKGRILKMVDDDELVIEGSEFSRIVELNASMEPHVLDIDPFTGTCRLSSESMRRAVQRYVRRKWWFGRGGSSA